MMNKINCAKEIDKILSYLESNFDLYIVERECKDSWDEDHAIFMIHLIEENYRDYNALIEDTINQIIDDLNHQVIIVYNTDQGPQNGYVLRIHEKNSGLAFEFELYRVENGKSV